MSTPNTETFPHIIDGNLIEPKTFKIKKEEKLKEIRYFDQEEIVDLILEIAQAEGFSNHDFDLNTKVEKFDENENLLYFALQIKEMVAREKNCSILWFIYTCVGEKDGAAIIKASSNIDSPDEVVMAEQILEYSESEGKWVRP